MCAAKSPEQADKRLLSYKKMIESVQARQRGAYDFESHYDNLCALQDSVPLAAVKANLSSGILDINADRVRAPDWPPIIHTLQINKSLEYVAIRSHFTPSADSNDKRAVVLKRKTPSIRSKEITFRLCKALNSCLAVTPTLMFIELTGVPLRERDINVLMKGVLKNTTLVHLSFELCRIGDNGLEMICKGLRGNNKITSINLTGCSLSARGAELIAKLIKHQAMKRHTEAWRDSLRYGVPQMDKMPGLRRVTLNNNPLISNQGAQMLAEALKDDLWVKALDMHGTGISTTGAKAFLDVLKYNTTIEVLDLRRNPLIDRSVLHSIMEHLMINCNGKETEYQWIEPAGIEEEKRLSRPQKSRRRTTKILNNSIGKKTTIKVTPTNSRRCTKSSSAVGLSRQEMLEALKPTPGLPWRTAARANRFRGFPPERTPRKPTDDISEADTTSILITREDSYVDQSLDTVAELKMLEEDRINADMQRKRERDIRELQVEMEQMRRMLKEERLERSKSDQKVMQLMMENRRLEDDLRMAKLRSASSSSSRQRETSMVQDDSVLDSIEASFKQFHAFLDMLREAGLGELINMAGLNQEEMPFSKSLLKSPNKSFGGLSSAHVSSNTGLRNPPQRDNLRPGSAGSATAMSHIDNSAYLKEKEEADEVYQRLLRQTSGAFTSGVTAKSHVTHPVTALTQPSGDTAADPKSGAMSSATPMQGDLSPTTPTTDRRRDPTPTLDSDKILTCPDNDPSPRPVPTPRLKPGPGKHDDDNRGGTGELTTERHIPSRTSDANYSMDSFEQSYISERGEVVVIGDDADLLESPNSRPINLDSEDEGF